MKTTLAEWATTPERKARLRAALNAMHNETGISKKELVTQLDKPFDTNSPRERPILFDLLDTSWSNP